MRLFLCTIFLIGVNWTFSQASPTSQENVPTTNDGVPIIEGSYFNSPNFTGGHLSSPFIPRPQDSASIHFPELNKYQNGFQESKRRRVIKRRSSRKLIKVKTADGSVISEIPHFSEEVTFRRANNADGGSAPGRGDIQVRSLDSEGVSGKESEGLRLYTKLIEEGPRRRRNNLRSLESRRRNRLNCSQVATEGKEFLTKPQCSPRRSCRRCASGAEANQLETRTNSGGEEMIYPVIQTIGQGDDQVNARILSSTNANQQTNFEQSSSSLNGGHQRQEISYTTGAKSRKGYYRRTVFKNFTTSEHPSTFAAWLN